MLYVKPDITVINRIIYYSNLLREARLALFQLRKTKVAIRGLAFTIPDFRNLYDVEMGLMRRIEEIKYASELLLKPLLEGKDFGHKYLNYWSFSITDVEQGYCEYEEILKYKDGKPNIYGNKYILLLRDYPDPTLGLHYGGTLMNFATASHFINDIPRVQTNTKGLYNAIISSIELPLKYPRLKL